MPYKDPESRRQYEANRYRTNRAKRRAQIKAWKRLAFARDPEAARAKWRQYRASGRARAALKEVSRIRAEKAKAAKAGYVGKLRPNGF